MPMLVRWPPTASIAPMPSCERQTMSTVFFAVPNLPTCRFRDPKPFTCSSTSKPRRRSASPFRRRYSAAPTRSSNNRDIVLVALTNVRSRGVRMARKKTKSAKRKVAARAKAKPTSRATPRGRNASRAKSPPRKRRSSKPPANAKAATVRKTTSKSKSSTKRKPKAPSSAPAKPAGAVPRLATPAVSNPPPSAPSGFQVEGTNANAPFTLKLHRGEGMTLLAMNWKSGQPPQDFVGFAIEYQEPGGAKYYALNNRLGFLDAAGNVDPNALSTLQSPIQKFRWVHFPRNADLPGDFQYRVTPMFMDGQDKLGSGEPQEVSIQLARETYPGIANVTFTRGFDSSQAFVDRYIKDGPIDTLVAPLAAKGLDFTSTHPDSTAALAWMGFEARAAIVETLDKAIA